MTNRMIGTGRAWRGTASLALALAIGSVASATELRVEVPKTRTANSSSDAADIAVREFAKRVTRLSEAQLTRQASASGRRVLFSMPVRVVLTQNGRSLPSIASTRGAGDIIPTFDASGDRAFAADYKAYLDSVFTSAKPFMNAIFGAPAQGGVVHVRNYDADIQDRYAVAGGYYIPNGTDGPEIRFPAYQNPVSTAVNYIHTLLLAYMGTNQYPFDAFNEGLVRAATIAIARRPGAIPLPTGYTQADVEATLETLYDVSRHYDWYNQPALGGPSFIAANLLNTPLPSGGSLGGIFLLRHEMAGSAWYKAYIENPGFIAEFNRRFNLSPGAYTTANSLKTLGQDVLDFLNGAPGGTIETLSFNDWFIRQRILDTRLSPGTKLLVHPIPVNPSVATDFGVFTIEENVFDVKTNGDEILLSGTSYPLYWWPDFTRFFATAQDDVISIAGAYGSVTPNFVSDTFAGDPYRVTVDVPYMGLNERVYLPAGAIATGASAARSNCYGTLVGYPDDANRVFSVQVQWSGGADTIPVKHAAFGKEIADATFLNPQRITVKVIETVGGNPVERFTRVVNKSYGPIALDLRTPLSDTSYTLSRTANLSMIGIPIDPWQTNAADVQGLSDSETLLARWDSILGKYAMYPAEGSIRQGLGYYVRPSTASDVTVLGRTSATTPIAVALKPGWNMISLPLAEVTPTTRVSVTSGTEPVGTWADALGVTIGTTFFKFVPDPTDPDKGTLTSTTAFEPGQGYFVRVLKPEGAVLLFWPSDFAAASLNKVAGRPTRTSTARSNSTSATTKVLKNRWEVEMNLREFGGASCVAYVGQTLTAKRGFDPKEDVDMPPLTAGLQLTVLGPMKMYRDMRAYGLSESYTVQMTGLVPGKTYQVVFRSVSGNQRFDYSDPDAFVNRSFAGSGRYTFVADKPTKQVNIGVGGAR